jgi:hypothetical protein
VWGFIYFSYRLNAPLSGRAFQRSVWSAKLDSI